MFWTKQTFALSSYFILGRDAGKLPVLIRAYLTKFKVSYRFIGSRKRFIDCGEIACELDWLEHEITSEIQIFSLFLCRIYMFEFKSLYKIISGYNFIGFLFDVFIYFLWFLFVLIFYGGIIAVNWLRYIIACTTFSLGTIWDTLFKLIIITILT